MPGVFYHRVIHGLGFFICFKIQMLRVSLPSAIFRPNFIISTYKIKVNKIMVLVLHEDIYNICIDILHDDILQKGKANDYERSFKEHSYYRL